MEQEIFQLATEAYLALAAVPKMPISEEEKEAMQNVMFALGKIIGLTTPKQV
jgi:hypothetical protein